MPRPAPRLVQKNFGVRNIDTEGRDFMLVVPVDIPDTENPNAPPPISDRSDRGDASLKPRVIIARNPALAIAGLSMGGLLAGYLEREADRWTNALVWSQIRHRRDATPMEPLVSCDDDCRPDAENAGGTPQENRHPVIQFPANIDDLRAFTCVAPTPGSREVQRQALPEYRRLGHLPARTSRTVAGIGGEHDATAPLSRSSGGTGCRQFQTPRTAFDIIPGTQLGAVRGARTVQSAR